MIIEICATSIESILNAQNAGAHRLELCQNYSIGGVTPSEQFLHEAVKVSSLPINVLIRPKGGGFIFNDQEYDLMINKINLFKAYNVKGFVIGFMEKDRSLNSDILSEFRKITKGFELTFHRAFDCLANQEESLELLIEKMGGVVVGTKVFNDCWDNLIPSNDTFVENFCFEVNDFVRGYNGHEEIEVKQWKDQSEFTEKYNNWKKKWK